MAVRVTAAEVRQVVHLSEASVSSIDLGEHIGVASRLSRRPVS